MNRLKLLGLGICAALAAACGSDKLTVPSGFPAIPFDSVAQADIQSTLRLFGGGGQWTIDLTTVIHNATNFRRTIRLHRFCPVGLQAYTSFGATGTPAWDSRMQAGCTAEWVTDTIAAGDSLVLTTKQTNTNEVLAHYGVAPANPPGQYFFYSSIFTDLAASGEIRSFVGFSQLGP